MTIHVLVAGLPRLLSEVVSAGLDQPPNLVVAGLSGEHVRPGSDELERAILTRRPDAVVVGMMDDEVDAVGSTRLRHPDMAVVAVAADCASAWNVAVRADFQVLDPVSPAGIRQAIYEAVCHLRATVVPIRSVGPSSESRGH